MSVKKEKELTNKEKATYIREMGFSSRSQSTLERLSKDELDKIIQLQRDVDKEEVGKEDKEATATLIQQLLDFLNSYKKERCNKEINPALRGFIVKNSENISIVNTKTSGILGIVLISIAGIYVFLDSILGIEKVKEILLKKKKPLQAENENTKN